MTAYSALGVLAFFILCCVGYYLISKLKSQQDMDGSRYVSWLPSFSVEVTRVRDAPALEAMARQVQQLFPQMPHALLAADLAHTRSTDLTIDNILEGRLQPPPVPPPLPPVVVVTDRLREINAMASRIAGPVPATNTLAISTADESRETNTESAIEFSQNAPERETLLRRRKDALLATARRRYLERVAAHAQTARTHTAQTPQTQTNQADQTAQTGQTAHSARS